MGQRTRHLSTTATKLLTMLTALVSINVRLGVLPGDGGGAGPMMACAALGTAGTTTTTTNGDPHLGVMGIIGKNHRRATTVTAAATATPTRVIGFYVPSTSRRRRTSSATISLHAVPNAEAEDEGSTENNRRRPPNHHRQSTDNDNNSGGRRRRKQQQRPLRPGSMEAAIAETGRVPYGEESRRYRRTVYGHSDWVKHRSNDRFLDNLLTIFSSGVVRQLAFEVTVVMASAMAVCCYNSAAGGYVDFSGTHHNGFLVDDGGLESTLLATLPALPFTLASPALGLLLVFRTNASYGRWMEARATWGRVSAQCKNVMRMAATWSATAVAVAADDGDVAGATDALADLSVRTYIFARTLHHSLRGPDEDWCYVRDVESGLSPEDASDLLDSRNRVTWAMQDLSISIDRLPIDEKRRVEIDKGVVILSEAVETCSKIYASPIPLVYTRHTARFLAGYLLLLPVGLWENFGGTWNHLGVVPVSAVIALFLFGIEELSIQLEEPFSILPLRQLVDGIRESGEEMQLWFSRSCGSDDRNVAWKRDGVVNDAILSVDGAAAPTSNGLER